MYLQNLNGVGYDYATAEGGIGLDEYYRRIYAGAISLTGPQLVVEMDTWGITPEDVAEAFRRNSGQLPQYNPTASDIAVSYAGGGGKNPEYLAAINTQESISSSQSYVDSLQAIDAAAEAALMAQTQAEAAAAAAAAAAAVDASNAARAAEAERLRQFYAEQSRIEAEARAAQDAAVAAAAQAQAQATAAAQAAAAAQAQAQAAAAKAAQDAAAAAAKVAADAAAATAKANADKAKAELDLKYGFFDRTIVDKTAEQKAQYFNFLKGQGKSEAVIFEAIAYWLGPQPPEDIAALKTLADELAKPRPIVGTPRVDVIPFTPGPGATTTTQPTGGNTALLLAAGLAALTLLG